MFELLFQDLRTFNILEIEISSLNYPFEHNYLNGFSKKKKKI